MMNRIAWGTALVTLMVGCSSSSSSGGADGGTPESGTPDSGSDAGADSHAADSSMDTSVADSAADTATGDTGAADAGDGAAPAHVVIADQFNNRVIEVDKQGNIVWHFGDGTSTAGPTSIVAPNDEERLPNGNTLIAGTGAPQNSEPSCTGAMGCPDNRVLIVNMAGNIVWQYGQAGMAGSGANMLNTPVCAVMLPNGNVLITDQANERVIEVTMAMTVAWTFPPAGSDGGATALNNPNSAERLANGNTLIADENNNRVIEVDMGGNIVWQYPQTPDPMMLSGAAFASRLANGNTLITDSNNNRILEVTSTFTVAWSYVTNMRAGSNATPLPTRAVRLANGDTLISDQFNHQVIEIDNAMNIVWSYGQLNMMGSMPGQLNGPYDAKVVGDFTGLTPPQ
jgi:hypothetical protein